MDEDTPDVIDRRRPAKVADVDRYREGTVAVGVLLSLAGVAGYDLRLAFIAGGILIAAAGLCGLLRGKR